MADDFHNVDILRGTGILEIDSALALLEERPELLAAKRARFDRSPQRRRSPSGTPTEYATTEPASPAVDPGERLRDETRCRDEIYRQLRASDPDTMFEMLTKLEEGRLEDRKMGTINKFGWRHWRDRDPHPKLNEREAAEQMVKERWIRQGIWSSKWKDIAFPTGLWSHREPLDEPESEMETDTDTEPTMLTPRPLRRKSEEKLKQIEQRRREEEHRREQSRPFHVFLHQVSDEREYIQQHRDEDLNLLSDGNDYRALEKKSEKYPTEQETANSEAYKIVKNRWVEKGIWDYKWGVLPGMRWKHEYGDELMEEAMLELGPKPPPAAAPEEPLPKPESPPNPFMAFAIAKAAAAAAGASAGGAADAGGAAAAAVAGTTPDDAPGAISMNGHSSPPPAPLSAPSVPDTKQPKANGAWRGRNPTGARQRKATGQPPAPAAIEDATLALDAEPAVPATASKRVTSSRTGRRQPRTQQTPPDANTQTEPELPATASKRVTSSRTGRRQPSTQLEPPAAKAADTSRRTSKRLQETKTAFPASDAVAPPSKPKANKRAPPPSGPPKPAKRTRR